jgi:N-acetylneuraminic acid mutarotase
MYIFGGENSQDEMLNDLYRLDLQTLKWTYFHSFGQMPAPRRYSSLVSKGNTLFLFGGRDEEVRMNDMWMFNCLSENWTPIQTYGAIPSLRSAHTCEILGDSMFIFGGMDGEKINEIHEFDTLTSTWKLLEVSGKFKPEARYWHSSVITDDGEMYIHGGGDHDSVRSDLFKIKLRSKVMNLQRGLFYSLNFGKLTDTLVSFQ